MTDTRGDATAGAPVGAPSGAPGGGPPGLPARTQVLVVGGGPVGLAAVIEARAAGLDVVLVEPRRGPVDKACGEGLMPGAVAALDRLGVRPAGHPIAGIRYLDDRRSVTHRFRGAPGLGVRRTTLHAALSARVDELGVARVATKVTELEQDDDGVTAAGIRADWLLGCDGLHSTVRRLAGLDAGPREQAAAREQGAAGGAPGRDGGGGGDGARGQGGTRARGASRGPSGARGGGGRRYGTRRHFRVAPWTDVVEVHWGPRAEAYVTPVAPDLVGVALLGPPGTGFDETLATFPRLSARLAGVEADGPVRGAGPLRQRTSARTAGRVRLVGDASGYVDALTGEGLRVGFAQAAAAVATLGQDPDRYERAWADSTRDYRVLTSGLVAAATSPVRGAIMPLATHLPALYAAIVERLAR